GKAHPRGQDLTPRMAELHDQARPVSLDGTGQTPKTRDRFVPVRPGLPRRRAPVRTRVQVAGDDEGRATARDGLVEGQELGPDEPIGRGSRLGRRGLEQPAWKGDATER